MSLFYLLPFTFFPHSTRVKLLLIQMHTCPIVTCQKYASKVGDVLNSPLLGERIWFCTPWQLPQTFPYAYRKKAMAVLVSLKHHFVLYTMELHLAGFPYKFEDRARACLCSKKTTILTVASKMATLTQYEDQLSTLSILHRKQIITRKFILGGTQMTSRIKT